MAYAIDGIVRSGYLYCLTGRTGVGKTSFNVVTALAVATGRADILGREVERGRVAYFAFENPDDARMRFLAAAYRWGICISDIADQIEVFDVKQLPEQLCGELAARGPFALVLVDTLQSFFDIKSSNDNAEVIDFLSRVRPMTRVRGNPAVIISAHPTKNAGDDALTPYGAGGILNEVDGNLAIAKRGGRRIELHWQGKLRGPDFLPVQFRIEPVCSPDVVDNKGRQISVPVMLPDEDLDEAAPIEANRKLLRALAADPGATQRTLATASELKSASIVNRRLALSKQWATHRFRRPRFI